MYINQIFKLSMVLDHERFQKVFKSVYSKAECMGNKEDEYIDRSLEEKGIVVTYRDSQYKKKIKVIVNIERLQDGSKPDPDKIVRKIDKRIREYFSFRYMIDDFFLSGIRFMMDINVWSRENVRAYLIIFQRIGKVKGFSKVSYECFEDIDNFCFNGNSNGINFIIYDLEGLYRNRLNEDDIERKKVKKMIKESEGILKAEVRLTKPKAIKAYVDSENISMQIRELQENSQNIFLDAFMRIIPVGDFIRKIKQKKSFGIKLVIVD